jgi:hypothetical protein
MHSHVCCPTTRLPMRPLSCVIDKSFLRCRAIPLETEGVPSIAAASTHCKLPDWVSHASGQSWWRRRLG